jgi:HEAT repeat protein
MAFATPHKVPDSNTTMGEILKPQVKSRVSTAAVVDALKTESFEVRMSMLGALGAGTEKILKDLFDSPTQTMAIRWRALTAYGRLLGKDALPELEKITADKDWYMRSAAMLAISKIEPERAKKISHKLLDDPALVVRLSAVDTMDQLKDSDNKKLLWQRLDHPSSFRRKQSLAIRKRIVETLSSMETKGSEKKFVELLKDRDESIHPVAISALERLTQQRLGTDKDQLAVKRAQWIDWGKTIK